MKHTLFSFFLFSSFLMQAQCFDCAKTFGGHVGGEVYDLKKTDNAVYVTIATNLTTDKSGIYKYDLNCNFIWKKEFGTDIIADYFTIDDQGNLYVLVTETEYPGSAGYHQAHEPYYINGIELYFGVNLYKISPNGDVIWNRKIGRTRKLSKKIFFNQGNIYITGAFNKSIHVNNQILLNETSFYGRAFIAKFDTSGNLLDAKKYGAGDDIFRTSEIDKNGNIYFARTDPNATYTSIDKINSNLEEVWKKEISNNGNITNKTSYRPTTLHYNPINDKLYLWGCFERTTTILGNTFTTNSNNNGFFQSILTEFNTTNGNLERFKQINTNSLLEYPDESNVRRILNKPYMTEKNNELFILSSFNGIMSFPETTIESRAIDVEGEDRQYNEELVLFKMNLSTFDPQFIFKSSSEFYYSNVQFDAAGPIVFDGNNLFLTSNFQSYRLKINNSVIQNSSGNGEPTGLLYKLNFDSTSISGEILVKNTCFNTPTSFKINGALDSILWNFDDPNSTTNNTSNIQDPQHQFTEKGTYNVSATIQCGSESQTMYKEITITEIPTKILLDPINACESISGSGLSNSFDTSNINSTIIANQPNLVVEYKDSNGTLLPSPLPNPYTNTTKNDETIIIRSYFTGNPLCFAETNLKLHTIPKTTNPIVASPQNFCIQQNATLKNITVAGQNLKWYNAAILGIPLDNTTILQNDTTYYVSQISNDCESERVPVTVKIQNTSPPTADTNQPFCTGQNPTLENIQINGNLIKWYDLSTNGTLLQSTTPLENGKIYYASQTVNNCESKRLGVIVSIGDTPLPPLELNTRAFCKIENATLNNIQVSGQNLKWYNSTMAAAFLPSNTLLENNTTYYVSQTTGCESDRTPILVKVNDTGLPISKAEQNFCLEDNATIANLNITGTGISWYNVATGGTTLADATVLQNGTYYATQTLNNCESERLPIVVKIQNTTSPRAESPQSFCIQKNTTINDLTISGEKIKWYESSSSQSSLSETTAIEDGITYYASQTINSCESDRIPVTINILGATTGDCINLVNELPFPKFFTPNNDSYNDTWSIDFEYLTPNSSIKIFDRYGKFIKELFKKDTWDGNYQNQELPASDYWFTATRSNGTEFRGHFSLKR